MEVGVAANDIGCVRATSVGTVSRFGTSTLISRLDCPGSLLGEPAAFGELAEKLTAVLATEFPCEYTALESFADLFLRGVTASFGDFSLVCARVTASDLVSDVTWDMC